MDNKETKIKHLRNIIAVNESQIRGTEDTISLKQIEKEKLEQDLESIEEKRKTLKAEREKYMDFPNRKKKILRGSLIIDLFVILGVILLNRVQISAEQIMPLFTNFLSGMMIFFGGCITAAGYQSIKYEQEEIDKYISLKEIDEQLNELLFAKVNIEHSIKSVVLEITRLNGHIEYLSTTNLIYQTIANVLENDGKDITPEEQSILVDAEVSIDKLKRTRKI